MGIPFLLLIIGFVLVAKGGDMFVDSSVVISRRLGIPRMVIGGTIVSLATTFPELFVSVTASLLGDSGIAIGNAVGSAIANIGLIVGVTGLLTVVEVDKDAFKRRSLWMVGSAFLVLFFGRNLMLSREIGWVLLLVSALYLLLDVWNTGCRKQGVSSPSGESFEEMSLSKAFLFFLIGAGLVILGSRFLVFSGIRLATALGVSSAIIGLSVIAVGTSLPELVTAVSSARKGVPDLSIGNIVGANVLNLAMILGASAALRPLTMSQFTRVYSFPWLIIFVLLMVWMLGREGRLRRNHGIILLGLYILYFAGLVLFPFLGVGLS